MAMIGRPVSTSTTSWSIRAASLPTTISKLESRLARMSCSVFRCRSSAIVPATIAGVRQSTAPTCASRNVAKRCDAMSARNANPGSPGWRRLARLRLAAS